jgi:hypothetical protein
MFASRTKNTVEIRDEDASVSVVIRKLSAKSLEKARLAKIGEAADSAKRFGPELLKVLTSEAPAAISEKVKTEVAEEVAKRKAKASKYDEFDRWTTLQAGVESWTAMVPLREGLEDLDEEAADTLFKAIIDISVVERDEGKG